MAEILNITNGDCAAEIMRKGNIEGIILPWRDVLHEGPVLDFPLEELSTLRAEYIASRGWGPEAAIAQSFRERDEKLKHYKNYQSIILWFEHDLYDQLQLLQVLSWFSSKPERTTPLFLICVDRYLGRLTPEQMSALQTEKTAVTEEQLLLAVRVWASFTGPDPSRLESLLKENTTALPFLQDAIVRLLEEYPSNKNGLSRTANQALRLLAKDSMSPSALFSAYSETEQRLFMGDASFWQLLGEMLYAKPPLIALPENVQLSLPPEGNQMLSITKAGRNVLAGKVDATQHIKLDRWLGGVHLTAQNNWRWDETTKTLLKK